jgi:outer membrane receptor for ferrienterochelin and colicins
MKIVVTLVCLFLFSTLQAQLKGVVLGSTEKEKTPLYGAKAILLKSGLRAISNEDGKFEIILPKDLPDTLVVSANGYYPDTVVLDKRDRFVYLEVVLYTDQLLPEVIVRIQKGTTSISRLKTLHVEEISSGELKKAACCNLSESFETNASVDVNITDAVSGAKKIQMMGLDGVYTQLQMENIPYLRGLESSYGLTSLPGTWIESMQITKGSGTVINGYESMAGLINIELKKPFEMERFYLNTYVNQMGRNELNLHSGIQLNKKWSTALFAHYASHPFEVDSNKDGFRDMPNGLNSAFLNRYHYQGKKMEAQFGVSFYSQDLIGGSISQIRRDSTNAYNVGLDARNLSAFAKTGFFLKKTGHSLGILYHYKHHEQTNQFGLRNFKGIEDRAYSNLIYDGIIGTTIHKYKVGASIVYSNIEQSVDSLVDNREEIVPGVFAEYTYTGLRLIMVAGARYDLHNLFGEQFVPRLHLKYLLTENTDLRFTGGKGWRVPNYLIDNNSLLATSRVWVAPTEVQPEISWNVGGSVVHEFKILGRKATLSADYYHTYFENQLIVDRDMNPEFIYFRNVENSSFSNSLQTEFSFSPFRNFDIRMAYKYLDVRSVFNNELQQQVMMPKHRGFMNLAYETRNKRWNFDLTLSLFGKSRLPIVMTGPDEFTTKNTSDVVPMMGGQVTHTYKKWEWYLGGENMLNVTQENPIISVEDPFSPYFNATRVWAPVYGINIYAGMRYTLEKRKE